MYCSTVQNCSSEDYLKKSNTTTDCWILLSQSCCPTHFKPGKIYDQLFQQIGHKFYDGPYSVTQSENHSRCATKNHFRCRKVNAVMSICSGKVWQNKPLSAMEPACKVNYCIQTTCSEAIKWQSVWGRSKGTKDTHWYIHTLYFTWTIFNIKGLEDLKIKLKVSIGSVWSTICFQQNYWKPTHIGLWCFKYKYISFFNYKNI